MKRIVHSLFAVLVLLGLSNTAIAGGGPPQTFADYKYLAEQYITPQIAYFNLTGELQYWSETPCVGWTNMTDNLQYYFEYEAQFRSAAAQAVTANSWAIKYALKTGENLAVVPTYKLNRLKAQQKLALMDQWHA